MLKYSVVGVTYTRTCPLSCAHCIVESSPKAQGKMQPHMVESYLDTISHYSDTICFTGGEPLLYYNEVIPLIKKSVHIGLKVTLVTGGGWVRERRIAEERIRGLKEAGLSRLCISWDPYHEEFSPGETVLLLASLAKEVDLDVVSRGVIAANADPFETENRLVQISVPYQKINVIRLGRAATLPEEHFKFAPEVEKGGCDIVATPVIEPDGTVYACCGPGRNADLDSALVLGNVNNESLESIFQRASNDPLFEAIFRVGPKGLYHLVKDHPAIASLMHKRDRYTGICELCIDMCNSKEVINLVREQLRTPEVRALLVAAKLKEQFLQHQEMQQLVSSTPITVPQGDLHAN